MMSASADVSGASVDHPPYKPEPVSCDFWAFLMLECQMQKQKFGSQREVMKATATIICHKMSENGLLHVREMHKTAKSVQLVNGGTMKRKLLQSLRIPQTYKLMSCLATFQIACPKIQKSSNSNR
jgi:hypothetical protein